jgi:hypothetical protein
MMAFIEMKYSRLPDLSVILKCQPPICLDYRARNEPQLKTPGLDIKMFREMKQIGHNLRR